MTPDRRLPKPDSCKGCPMYGDGMGYVPDTIIPNPTFTVVAQNPGEDEERGRRVVKYVGRNKVYEPCTPAPLIGPTGYWLRERYIPRAGASPEEVSYRNILRCRWRGTNDLPTGDTLVQAVQHCTDTHPPIIPSASNPVIAHGALAWKVLAGAQYPLSEWRGYTAPHNPHLFATLHTSATFRSPRLEILAMSDWMRIGIWLGLWAKHERWPRCGTWPHAVPDLPVVPTTLGVEEWVQVMQGCGTFALDTEFLYDRAHVPGKHPLTWIGMAGENQQEKIVGVLIDWTALTRDQQQVVAAQMRDLVRASTVVMHHAVADIPVLEHNLGIRWGDYRRVEDTILLHYIGYPDHRHDLETLASVYGRYPKMKHLAKTDPVKYLTGDVLETWSVWKVLMGEVQWWKSQKMPYYREVLIPLIPRVIETQQTGIRVDRARVQAVQRDVVEQVRGATLLARAYCGWPINLASAAQVGGWVSGRERLSKAKTIAKDTLVKLRGRFGPPLDGEWETKQGGLTLEQAVERVRQGAHPLLEARAVYARAQQVLGHYVLPMLAAGERVHPTVHLHTQVSGRLSWVNPPMAQLPPKLRDMVVPDEEWPWFGYDLDQEELRIVAALADIPIWLEAFEKGYEIHTLNTCLFLGYDLPQDKVNPMADRAWVEKYGWQGKDDVRRTFGKRATYRLLYRGDPKTMDTIPGAAALGVPKKVLVQAAHRFLHQVPQLREYWKKMDDCVRMLRSTWSFMGFHRHFGWPVTDSMLRAASNHPMQAGGADIFKTVWRRVAEAFPGQVVLKYGAHDSFVWGVHRSIWRRETLEQIAAMSEGPWEIGKHQVRIPATYYTQVAGRPKRPWRPGEEIEPV